MRHKTQLLIGSLLVILAAIPVSLLLTQEPQDTRTRATASTTLTYAPNTTSSAPLQKNVGDPVAVDIIVNPGSNLPSLVRLEMAYDTTKFQLASSPFTVNTAAFPTTIEGPVILEGRVLISLSIGSDATKAIQTSTKVGTLNLIAKAPTTSSPTQVSFGTRSQVLSLAKNDEATENVLATTQPSYITIASPASPTTIAVTSPTVVPSTIPTTTPLPTATIIPTPTPTRTPTQAPTVTRVPSAVPSMTPVATLNPTQTPIPTPTVNPQSTSIAVNVLIHGIGSSGDNANPLASDMSNKTPQHPSRNVTVSVYDDQNQLFTTKSGLITYDTVSGSFKGVVDLGNTLQNGDYTVRVKEDTHLRRLVPGIQQLAAATVNTLPAIEVIAGDVNKDNTLNILDYNLLVGCYSDLLPAISCTEANKILTDLNDNGAVNQFDYNLFLREITVQSGS